MYKSFVQSKYEDNNMGNFPEITFMFSGHEDCFLISIDVIDVVC